MTRANANALFQGLKSQPSFTNVITIARGDPEEKTLLSARQKIRSVLRAAFGKFQLALQSEEVRQLALQKRDAQSRSVSKHIKSLDIRFLTQGSHAYGTLNRPAQPAFQEIDLDDGIYIPMPFVAGQPVLSSDGLFNIIEQTLAPLVKANAWGFERKSTCVRITLTGKNSHIDLPLFAVEDIEFRNLSTQYERQLGVTFRKTAVSLNEVLDTRGRNIRLSTKSILLADRDRDWRPSDPKAIHDWFEDQVTRYGPVLRRTCRYLKAWRDHSWQTTSLSSLTLMATTVDALRSFQARPAENRDDLIVLQVAETLPQKFEHGGIVWRSGEESLDSRWSPEERGQFAVAARKLTAEMNQALHDTYHRETVIKRLRTAFGDRIPFAPDSIDIAAAKQTAAVLETRAASVAMPVVGTSISG